jgi:hypothetical protein
VTKLATTLAIGSLLAFPATALAGHGGHHNVPPGNSGLDQYTENIPGAGGNHPTGGGGGSHHQGGGGGGNGSSVSPGVTSTLNSQGPAGQGAASLATATAPDVGGPAHHGGTAQAPQGGKGGGSANATGNANTHAKGANAGTSGGAAHSGNAASGNSGSGSGVDAIAAELTGAGVDNGMGVFLPIILGVALVGALALVALRLRRGPQQTGS